MALYAKEGLLYHNINLHLSLRYFQSFKKDTKIFPLRMTHLKMMIAIQMKDEPWQFVTKYSNIFFYLDLLFLLISCSLVFFLSRRVKSNKNVYRHIQNSSIHDNDLDCWVLSSLDHKPGKWKIKREKKNINFGRFANLRSNFFFLWHFYCRKYRSVFVVFSMLPL